VDRELLVRGHRAVDKAPARPVGVQLAEPLERPLALPELEHLELERGVIRLVREACEHAIDSRVEGIGRYPRSTSSEGIDLTERNP
jgi:hypothetical protein